MMSTFRSRRIARDIFNLGRSLIKDAHDEQPNDPQRESKKDQRQQEAAEDRKHGAPPSLFSHLDRHLSSKIISVLSISREALAPQYSNWALAKGQDRACAGQRSRLSAVSRICE
jgi:hypothetical protein